MKKVKMFRSNNQRLLRLVSVIMAILVCLTNMSVTAYAYDEETIQDTETVVNHNTKTVITKASLKSDGKVEQICQDCNAVIASSTLPKIGNVYLSQETYAYNGKAKKPKVYVYDEKGLVLTKGTDYTVSYASGRKNCGKYKVVVTFKGNYTGKKTLYFSILPEGTDFTSTKIASKTSISLKWEKVKKGITGYQIQYSTSSKFKKGTVVSKKIKGYKNISTTIKKLKTSKTYYIRIRTYSTVKKKTTYSEWSDVTKLSLKKRNYSVKKLINTEKLNPQKTNDEELDKLIDKIFKKIHKKKMTTYEKVKACFDYLIKTVEYDYSYHYDNTRYVSDYDSTVVDLAKYVLTTKTGDCNAFSAAFMVMCRRIGLDIYITGGTISKKGGGRTNHAWTYMVLNGTQYIFDPQVQSSNMHVPYYYFGKTYKQMGSTYNTKVYYNYDEKDYSNFELLDNIVDEELEKNISCEITATGKNDIINHSAMQNGYSISSYISYFWSSPLEAYENGFVDMKIDLSGGSGQYEVLLVDDTTGDVIYDYVCDKSFEWEINLSRFKSDTVRCHLVVYDYNSNYNSYIEIYTFVFER